MKNLPFAAVGAFLGVLVTSVLGCELIASVDGEKIGAAGGGSPTTTSSKGGAGGIGGAVASGGAGGTGGVVASGGAGGTGGVVASGGAGGQGGTGGGTGGVGAGGAGGGMPCVGGDCQTCTIADDCPGADSECQKRTCASGICGVVFTPKGTPITAQTAGDCKVTQCDGKGTTQIADDDSDVPNDKESCTDDLCTAGSPSNPPQAAITACSEGTGKECDGAGKCVECIVASDCPGTDTECSQRSCSPAGVCGTTFTALGTLLKNQTIGDCKKAVCDGAGATTTQNDDSDASNDNNACTDDVCTAGVPSHPNVANGVTCGPSLTCLAGSCTGCGVASDCPGVDDECKTRTCVAQVCGHTFTANGFVVAAQASGDCKKNECDGAGNTASVNDDTDLPADDGVQCTSEVCTGGTASHPLKATDTPCGPSNGSFCNATGACVACNTASECPGADTECQTRACVNNACTFTFQLAGFATSAQTSGDCKVNQCDGAGQIVAANANSDVPADDGSQCTGEVCNSGVPSHPPQPIETTCNQDGGSHCNATGTCVACNTAAECPGVATACQAPACVLNACTVSFQPAGTPGGAQTPGDCQATVCDGAGKIVSTADNGDIPADDGFQCTGETCMTGVPAHPPQPVDTACNQNGGSHCSLVGTCVACNVATECPGTDSQCETRVCTPANTCAPLLQPAGTPLSTQIPGDCQTSQCDGAGNIMGVADDTDTPPDDGEECTADVCIGGTPVHSNQPIGTTCDENGGTHCTASGTCSSSCSTAAECPGATTECGAPACISNVCTFSFQPAGTPVSTQIPSDCHTNECDGAGNVIDAVDDTDTPLDDGNQCTSEVCFAGVPAHQPQPVDTTCNQNGGSHCDGATTCVECTADVECPGAATACGAPACVSNACTTSFQPAGTPTDTQTVGDCQQSQCDGTGNIVSVADDADLPADTNPCTTPTCTAGGASTPPVAAAVACIGPGGAGQCDGAGNCVACLVDADCGTSTTCQTFTCNAGSCAIANTAFGKACTEGGGAACDGAGACGSPPAVVVVRLGTGAAALSGAATPVFLEERFVADGSLVSKASNPLALPTAVSGSNARLTLSGTATSEGALALSADGHFVTLAGYDADAGSPAVASTSSATVNRIAGRVDASFAIDTTTRINALISGNNARSAVTDDGSHFWVGGAANGVVAIPFGATGGTSIITTPAPALANVRALNIFGGQLYGSASSGTFTNVFTVGAGLPTTAGAAATKLPGMPTTTASPYAYLFFDLDPTINNSLDGGTTVLNAFDRLYVADDRGSPNGGVQRWNYSPATNTWVLSATLNQVTTGGGAPTFTSFRGVTGFISSGTTITLIATSSTGTALVTFVDDGTSTPVGTTIATTPTNTVFRGVALPPH